MTNSDVFVSINEEISKNEENKKIFGMKLGDTYKHQDMDDFKNQSIIEKAYQDGRLTKDRYEHLKDVYSNTMYKYGKIYYHFIEIFGKPREFQFRDTVTGEMVPTMRSNGKNMRSSLRCVTPTTSIVLVYEDQYGNPFYIDLPGMKNVNRAIEKYEIGGEYDLEYEKELRNLRVKYAVKDFANFVEPLSEAISKLKENVLVYTALKNVDSIYKNNISVRYPKFEYQENKSLLENMSSLLKYSEGHSKSFDNFIGSYLKNIELALSKDFSLEEDKVISCYHVFLGNNQKYSKEKGLIREPKNRANDIFRYTVTTRYVDNTKLMLDKIISHKNQNTGAKMNLERVSDKMLNNVEPTNPDLLNSRGNRDIKYVTSFDIDGVPYKVEIQGKIDDYRENDVKTHKEYVKVRNYKRVIENMEDKYSKEAGDVISKKIYHSNSNRMDNINSLKKYNTRVVVAAALDDLRRFKEGWDDKMGVPMHTEEVLRLVDERSKEFESFYEQEPTPEVVEFLKNLMSSPHVAFDEKDFPKYEIKGVDRNSILIEDEVTTIPEINKFVKKYIDVISKAYIMDMKDVEKYTKDFNDEEYSRFYEQSSLEQDLRTEVLVSDYLASQDEDDMIEDLDNMPMNEILLKYNQFNGR